MQIQKVHARVEWNVNAYLVASLQTPYKSPVNKEYREEFTGTWVDNVDEYPALGVLYVIFSTWAS